MPCMAGQAWLSSVRDAGGAFTFHSVINDTDELGRYWSLWKADAPIQKSLVMLPTHKGVPAGGGGTNS